MPTGVYRKMIFDNFLHLWWNCWFTCFWCWKSCDETERDVLFNNC